MSMMSSDCFAAVKIFRTARLPAKTSPAFKNNLGFWLSCNLTQKRSISASNFDLSSFKCSGIALIGKGKLVMLDRIIWVLFRNSDLASSPKVSNLEDKSACKLSLNCSKSSTGDPSKTRCISETRSSLRLVSSSLRASATALTAVELTANPRAENWPRTFCWFAPRRAWSPVFSNQGP